MMLALTSGHPQRGVNAIRADSGSPVAQSQHQKQDDQRADGLANYVGGSIRDDLLGIEETRPVAQRDNDQQCYRGGSGPDNYQLGCFAKRRPIAAGRPPFRDAQEHMSWANSCREDDKPEERSGHYSLDGGFEGPSASSSITGPG